MDENLIEAMIMAFSAMVFVIALTLTLYMFSKVAATSELLTSYADSTRFYNNIEISRIKSDDEDIKEGRVRVVDASTVIPTLYRYYKENFCVKIYDATSDEFLTKKGSIVTQPRLIQIFDVSLEGKVNKAVTDTNATQEQINNAGTNYDLKAARMRNKALIDVYNVKPTSFASWDTYANEKFRLYMFGAPWIGSTENTKRRIDYFVNGSDGYINNQYVCYVGNSFWKAISTPIVDGVPKYIFTERVISYSYTGDTVETDDGDLLVTGAASKDKIVIIYTIHENKNGSDYFLE